MPLPLLIALVVTGIAGIAALTWALGFAAPRRLSTEAEVRAAWEREFPAVPVDAVTLCRSGSAALVATTQGPGLVWAMGADTTARLLQGARLERGQGALRLRLPDYAAPVVSLDLDPAEAEAWTATLKGTP